jgi:acetyl esterase/lipase
MPTVTTEVSLLTGTDDATYDNSSYTDSANTHWIGVRRSSGVTVGNWGGFRFRIPTSVDPSRITSVKLSLYNITAGNTVEAVIRVEQSAAAAWSSSGSNRPDNRYNAVGSSGEVAWNYTSSVGRVESPDISARVISALANIDQGSDYLGILIGPSAATVSRRTQYSSQDTSTAANRPLLIITEDVPAEDAEVTTVAPSVAAQTPDDVETGAWTEHLDVSYHDGIGSSTRRSCNVYVPYGTPPSGGWPVILFVHGGSWIGGSRNSITSKLITRSISAGWAIISISYKLSDWNVLLNTNTGANRPSHTQDVLCATKWIAASAADTYGLNPDKLVGMAYSAGAHLLLEAALLIEDPDRDTYVMAYNGASGTERRTTYNASTVLNFTQGRTGFPSFRGLFLWAGPVRLSELYGIPLVQSAARGYIGQLPNNSLSNTATAGEGNLNDFITAASGSIYDTRSERVPPFPIAYCEDTTDLIVPPDAGLTPLRAALDAVGYDVSAGNGVVNPDGLSYRSYAGSGHDWLLAQNDWTFWRNWLDAVPLGGEDDTVTTTAPSAAASTGSPTVTISAEVTTTAPSAAASTGSPTVETGFGDDVDVTAPIAQAWTGDPTVSISAEVTTTAPSVTAGTGDPTVDAGSGDTVTTTAPSVTVITAEPSVSTATAGEADPAAAALVLGTGEATVVVVDAEVLTAAPTFSVTAGEASTAGSTEVTATAPSVALDLPAPSVSTAAAGEADPAAAGFILGTGTPTVSVSSSDAVTVAAPGFVAGVGLADASSGASVATAAPALVVSADAPTVVTDAAVSTTAPTVTVTAPAPSTGTGLVLVTAARLLPPSWSAVLVPTSLARLRR